MKTALYLDTDIFKKDGLHLPEGISYEQWEKIGAGLQAIDHRIQWWVGDWLNFGERKFGEMYSQALEATDYEYDVLRHLKRVSQSIEFGRRRPVLSWSHHYEIAKLNPELQERFLDIAENEGLSTKELRLRINCSGASEVIQKTDAVKTLQELLESGEKFGAIYADPPWKYGNQGTRAATDNHYPTLTTPEIIDLPIKELAEEKSHLHIWTTNAFLFDCRDILEAWGFEYKGIYIWTKPQMGIGNYWRVSHEILMLGVRGKQTFLDRSQMSWINVPRTQHSKKPHVVREIIEKVSPGPYLELFARETAHNWTVWGNEIAETLFNKDILL